MNIPLIYTFCSLALTSISDLMPKLGMNRIKSRGGYIAVIGLVEVLTLCWLPMGLGSHARTALLLSFLGGVLSVCANILLIESMRFLSASLSACIYRLNMIFVFLGAFLFLNENVTAWQWLGIALAVFSVIIFSEYKRGNGDIALGLLMAACASLLRAGMGLVYKQATTCGVNPNTLSLITGVCWLVAGVIYSLLREGNLAWLKDRKANLFSMVAGLIVSAIVFCMAHSLDGEDAKASIMLPIAQMSFVPTFVLEVIVLHEKVTLRKVTALIGCVAAIMLLILGGR